MKKELPTISALCVILILFSSCNTKPPLEPPDDLFSPLPSLSLEPSSSVSPPEEAPTEASPSVSPSEAPERTVEDIGAQIEERYGVKVTWDQDLVVYGWSQPPVSDFDALYRCLVIIDEQLGLYPEGFFRTFERMGYPMQIILTDSLINEEGEMAGGRAEADNTKTIIVLEVSEGMLGAYYPYTHYYAGCPFFQYTLHHEIGHTIYQHVFDFDIGETFDVFGEFWGFLPPNYVPGGIFIMNEKYQAYIPVNDIANVYFCDSYAMTDNRENMASLFGYSMCPEPPWTFESPHVQDQLRYFFNTIRKIYGASGWPAETYWEQVLHG